MPTNVLHNDAGRYNVAASTDFGSVTSSTAMLMVIEPAIAAESSSNLVDWLRLQTSSLGSGWFYFNDLSAKPAGRQFCRAHLLP